MTMEASSTLDVQVIHTEPELAALRKDWNDALAESPADCLFLTWEWLSVWWRHFGAGRRLHVITVRSAGKLLGLAPLFVVQGRLEFMGTGAVGSDYLDFIVRRERAQETIEALARAIEGSRLNARLGALLEESAAFSMARRFDATYHVRERVTSVCPYTLLGESWETYISSLGARHRENVRRRIRKLPQDHTFTVTRTGADLERDFPVFIDLHNRRWDTRGGSDALRDESLQAFHREFTRLALERDWLRLFVLSIGNRPAASVYAFLYGGKALYYQAGVDPEFNSQSVGLVALALWARDAITEGARELDFLHGDETYKSLWASQTRELRVMELYQRSLRGRLTMHSRTAIRAARRMARYVIKR
jgi:CelD/BcsL family acetyltransferase involved in cellulose biosynthesis